MGWKSTLTLSREEAIAAIMAEYARVLFMSNNELEEVMNSLFGDDFDKPYYGHNFWVTDRVDDEI